MNAATFLCRSGVIVLVTSAAIFGAVSCGGGGGGGGGSGSSANVGNAEACVPGVATTTAASCADLYSAHPLTLVSGTTAHNEGWPCLDKPTKTVAMLDETYGTCRVRATNHTTDGTNTFARNDYSRRQAFNADSSKFLIYALDGSWWLYDAATYAKIKDLPQLGGDAEPQWHPTNPNILYWLPTNGGMVVNELDISTDTNRIVGDFNVNGVKARWPTAARVWTKSEGSPSADGRYWAFMVQTAAFGTLGFITWDRQTDTILAYHDIGSDPGPDHLSMSPTGNYVVVSWDTAVTVFNRDFTNRRILNPASPGGEHSDIALDPFGNDVYVSIDYATNGYVYMINLATLARTDLFPTYLASGSATGMHFSGKAFNKPGWVLMSTYAEYGSKQWLYRKVLAIKLTSSPTVYHLAHTHNVDNGYWTETHASVNRDFTKILFNSNWDTGSATDVDAYMIQIPPNSIQ